MTNKNLINLKERNKEERLEITLKGNKASLQVRRINKYIKLKKQYEEVKEEFIETLRGYVNKYGYYCRDLEDVILTLRKCEYRHYKSLYNKIEYLEKEIDKTAKQIIEEIEQ